MTDDINNPYDIPSEKNQQADNRQADTDDGPMPTVFTPSSSRFYGAEFDDLVERAPPPPAELTEVPDASPFNSSMSTDGSLVDTMPDPSLGTPIGEPDDSQERLKEQDNAFFSKLEEMMTEDNIDGMGKMLKSYAGLDVPSDKLKKIIPHFLPLLKKYGNRMFGGNQTEKFVAYSAEASKFAELANDAKPLLGAILEMVMGPSRDAQGNIVLRPDDDKAMEKMAKEVNDAELSEFLKDDAQQGDGTSPAPKMPNRPQRDGPVEPRAITSDGRGGQHEQYGAPQEQGPKIIETLDELMAKERARMGPSFDAEMAAIQRRDESLKATPAAEAYKAELRAVQERDRQMRAQPMLPPKPDPNSKKNDLIISDEDVKRGNSEDFFSDNAEER